MFLQKKLIMQILEANILMGISIVKNITVIVKLGGALAWIKFVFC